MATQNGRGRSASSSGSGTNKSNSPGIKASNRGAASARTSSGSSRGGSRSSSSRSSTSNNASAQKGRGSSYADNHAKDAKDAKPTNAHEISGIVIIIIGIILGIFCYGRPEATLAGIAKLFFGLLGIGAYILPIGLVAFGIYRIVGRNNVLVPKKTIFLAILVLCAMMFIHIAAFANKVDALEFGAFIKVSYNQVEHPIGGGAISGIFAWLLVRLIGELGSYVILVGTALIMLMLVTGLSFGVMAEKAQERKQLEYQSGHHGQVYSRRARIDADDDEVGEDLQISSRKRNKARQNEDIDEDTFPEHSGKPLTAGDYEYEYEYDYNYNHGHDYSHGYLIDDEDSGKRNKGSKSSANEITRSVRNAGREVFRRKSKSNDDLELFPTTGEISTERRRSRKRRNNDDILTGFDSSRHKSSSNRRKPGDGLDHYPEYGDETYDIPMNMGYEDIRDDSTQDDNQEYESAEPHTTAGILDGVVITTMNDDKNGYDPEEELETQHLMANDPGNMNDLENTEVKHDDKDRTASGSDESGKIKITSEIPEDVAVYQRPPYALLNLPDPAALIATESPEEKAKVLIETLNSFSISARIINISVGPVITRFELQPAQGIRVNRITTLSNDIALALAAPRVRIEAPIPGKAAIGIEIPNKDTAPVLLREVLETREFNTAKSPLTFALGKDIAGKVVLADLEKMPHMLIAGQTGAGKSVCINGIILSMIFKSSPKDVRMILIDPKVVELSIFSAIPHLFCPVVTEPKKAAGALQWAVKEMEQRYSKMGKINARDIYRYNALQENEDDKWPRLVIIIDELADLMMVASKDVEESICRIAQLGRACGIHLVVATQRPSVDVITGLIKANIPSRIAFAVSNATDSRVILDAGGAEKLLGKGDMLFHANGASKPTRAQGAFVSDEEVEAIMNFFNENKTVSPVYDESVLSEISVAGVSHGQGNGKQEDDLLPDAVRIVIESGAASISMIQRRLRVGYARAARLVDIMEQKKYVSASDGSKPRKVLIDAAEYYRVFGDSIQNPSEE